MSIYIKTLVYKCGCRVNVNSGYTEEQARKLEQRDCIACAAKKINFENFTPLKQAQMEIELDLSNVDEKETKKGTLFEIYWGLCKDLKNIPERIQRLITNALTLLLEDSTPIIAKDINKIRFTKGDKWSINKSIKENEHLGASLLKDIKIINHEIKENTVLFNLTIPKKYYQMEVEND